MSEGLSFSLVFDLAIDVGVCAAGRAAVAEPPQRVEDVGSVGADDQVDLLADFLGWQVDAHLHRLKAQILLGKVLLLLNERLHLLREAEATGELDGPLQKGHLGEPLGRFCLVDAQMELASS